MKKIFAYTIALVAFTISSLAQGTISFQATPANGLIDYYLDAGGQGPYPVNPNTPALAPYGNAHVGFFAAPNGTVLSIGVSGLPNFTSAWMAAGTVRNIATGDGRTAAYSFALPAAAGAPGQNVELEIVAWTGSATSWADALANGNSNLGWSGQTLAGVTYGALGWSQPTGNPNTTPSGTPVPVLTGNNAYHGVTIYISPEPSTTAIGFMGAILTGIYGYRKRLKEKAQRS